MKQIYADKYRQIGLKIAYYRKLRGLTQEELAEQAGLAPAFIIGFSRLSTAEFFAFRKTETCETKNHLLCGWCSKCL